MKKAFQVILGILGVLLVIGLFAGEKNDSASSTADSSAASQPKKETLKISAADLSSGYEKNEVAMDERLKGKIIEVSGVVQSIDKDFTDSIVLLLAAKNQFMPARMGLNDSEKAKAIQLEKGKRVEVRCENMSRVVGSPSGRGCVLL